MSVVPKKTVEKIQWYEDHLPPFTASAVAIGTSSSAVTDLGTKTQNARDAFTAQQAAIEAAKAATLNLRIAVGAMSVAGAAILKQIRAKGESSGDDGVYVLAQIPAPATPSPVPPPGTPESFKVQLNPDGSLKLSWKCANPVGSSGTTYQVFRKLAGEGAFTFLSATGKKTLTDATLPASAIAAGPVTYEIRAVRSTAVGTAAQSLVNFGVGGGGEMTAAIVSPSPKLAA